MRLTLVATLLLGAALACDSLLDVQSPSRVPASVLDDPANAQLAVDGAQADFECALASYAALGGMLAGELEDATLSAGRWDYDRRTVTSGGAYGPNQCNDGSFLGLYTPLSVARYQADNAAHHLQGWTDGQVSNRRQLIARASAYGGYSLTLLGEGFCSAAIDVGPQLLPSQLLDSAEARFSTAIAAATAPGDSSILHLALVGRARVRLARGDSAGALADAQLVPAGFEYDATYSSITARRENLVFQQLNKFPFNTIAVPYRKFMYVFADTIVPGKVDSVPDPRVAVRNDTGTTMFDNRHGQWVQLKYASIGAPIRLATGTEAQLIIAEIQGGPAAVTIINNLHAAAGLPPFRGTDPDSIRNQVIYERQAEFFLDGHHLGDVNRFQLTLFPAVGTPYPVDASNPKGGFYGTTTRFPLPDKERFNNPNIPSTVNPGC
jgi:hypothetical protein